MIFFRKKLGKKDVYLKKIIFVGKIRSIYLPLKISSWASVDLQDIQGAL